MYGYGTVEYHFGRAASTRATYTCSRSHADCHLASICRRSTDSMWPRGFAALRGRLCACTFLRRVSDRRAFGLGRGRGRPPRLAARPVWGCPVERWVEATSSPRAQIGAILVKLFAADSERRSTSFVTDERRLPFGIQNKNRTAIPGTMRSDDGGPLSYVV